MKEHTEKDGSILSDNEVFMNGMEVFNFVMRTVPKSIKDLCAAQNLELTSVGHLILHQANKFMTDFFTKKLKFNPDKVPYCIQKYGNTSSTSVPLTIVSELHDQLKDGDRVVMSGFGAGLSWGTASVVFNGCKISPVIEY